MNKTASTHLQPWTPQKDSVIVTDVSQPIVRERIERLWLLLEGINFNDRRLCFAVVAAKTISDVGDNRRHGFTQQAVQLLMKKSCRCRQILVWFQCTQTMSRRVRVFSRSFRDTCYLLAGGWFGI